MLLHRPVNARQFLFVGVLLFVAKFGIDRAVASLVFGRPWSLIDYLVPTQALAIGSMSVDDRAFYLAMTAVAVPFVLVGLGVTARRLRDAGLPLALLVLFFPPICNLLFFAALSVVPTYIPPRRVNARRIDAEIDAYQASLPTAAIVAETPGTARPAAPIEADQENEEVSYHRPAWDGRLLRLWPSRTETSFFLAAVLAGALAPMFVALGVLFLRQYGWGLFIGMPFVVGMIASLLHGLGGPRSAGASIGVSLAAGAVGFVGTVLFALEGIGCLIMLAPLAAPVVIAGGATGHVIANAARGSVSGVAAALVATLPLLMGAERLDRSTPGVHVATSAVEVDAPPEVVWRNVIEFGEIAPPRGWFFASGVAYPIRARIEGAGVGAVRYCEFSTGPFVEPITVWDAPRLLKFDVTYNPPPMREWSPFRIAPPHLEDFLKSHGGQFKLIDLGNGRTRVEGTTWYEHGLWPEAYWSLWSDYVIHRIHGRVLEHVKHLSERADG